LCVMPQDRYIAYYRVSTAQQGQSGLGLDAQREQVRAFLSVRGWPPFAEYVEVESGKKNDRPELQKALNHCRLAGATLCIAKLDRLGRNVHFISGLMESGVDFVAADAPDKDRFMLHVRAAFAEEEARKISERTKAALAAAKAKGTRLGNPNGWGGRVYGDGAQAVRQQADGRAKALLPIIRRMREAGDSFQTVAAKLAEQGIQTARGGQWSATQVMRIMVRAQ
jgi:DNA invertase Pin-like site-specific DNA recombinase